MIAIGWAGELYKNKKPIKKADMKVREYIRPTNGIGNATV